MKWFKRVLGLLLILVVVGVIFILVAINPFGASPFNRYTRDGKLILPGLKAPVTVHRDEKNMAFIYAADLEDLLMAQGFVTAQDRLFQMELTKLFASGRISEMAGEKARNLDIRMRTLGFHRQAVKHIKKLDEMIEKPGLVLMNSKAGRMVCWVVCIAPDTIPSAWPLCTIIVPK